MVVIIVGMPESKSRERGEPTSNATPVTRHGTASRALVTDQKCLPEVEVGVSLSLWATVFGCLQVKREREIKQKMTTPASDPSAGPRFAPSPANKRPLSTGPKARRQHAYPGLSTRYPSFADPGVVPQSFIRQCHDARFSPLGSCLSLAADSRVFFWPAR